MNKRIINNQKEWEDILKDMYHDIDGLGIEDYKGHYFYGKYSPEKYPFILIDGDFSVGCNFDHQQFFIIYPEDFHRNVWNGNE